MKRVTDDLRSASRVVFAAAWAVAAPTQIVRFFADVQLTDAAPAYSLVTTLFLLGCTFWMAPWLLGGKDR